jgi:hypothetical protein
LVHLASKREERQPACVSQPASDFPPVEQPGKDDGWAQRENDAADDAAERALLFQQNVGRFTFFALSSVIKAASASKRNELARKPSEPYKSETTPITGGVVGGFSVLNAAPKYLWVREYQDWNVSPALRVRRSDRESWPHRREHEDAPQNHSQIVCSFDRHIDRFTRARDADCAP